MERGTPRSLRHPRCRQCISRHLSMLGVRLRHQRRCYDVKVHGRHLPLAVMARAGVRVIVFSLRIRVREGCL